MAGLITVSDLQTAMNVTFSAGEAAQAQSLIDRLSAFIENYCRMSFQVVTTTVRVQADYYGVIKLAEKYNHVTAVGPVVDVVLDDGVDLLTMLSPFVPGPVPAAIWDHMSTIYGLGPNQVVDVTLTYGLSACPADIKGVLTEAASVGMGQGDPSDIKMVQIGDRIEQYSDAKVSSIVDAIGGLAVLNDYRETNHSLQLGPARVEPPASAQWSDYPWGWV